MSVNAVATAIVVAPPLGLCAIWLIHDTIVAVRSARRRRDAFGLATSKSQNIRRAA